MQFEEHARRVWSIDVCPTDPMRMVSGSDDHAVKLWSLNCESSQLTLDAKANVCSVQFHPTDCNIVACGAANYRCVCVCGVGGWCLGVGVLLDVVYDMGFGVMRASTCSAHAVIRTAAQHNTHTHA